MTPPPPVLQVEDLSVRLNGAEVLSRVNFEVGEGEFLTIIGPNGAGKSTLLRVLDGLVNPTRGQVRLVQSLLSTFDRRQLARIVSYVPQGDPGGVAFTVRAFVEMGRYAYLGPWSPLAAADLAAVDEALATTEVLHLADRQLGSLSGGERQRTLIAAALAQGGRLLLLDEPTSYLDYRHQIQVMDLLEHLHRDRGYAVVAVTHDLNLTVPLSDKVLALKEGEVSFHGRPEKLLDEQLLESIFSSPFSLIPVAGGPPLIVPARRNHLGSGS